ncbi:hypothetical protein AMATHDRAFT_88134 [Amanita thiersii Skay4041]|uniref:Extracellular metalloproteinase n=1 Tax=Amanita thiersii Skay4041 TaxID=703135 RepID=A0A2A9N9N9_9AGAR|nr:hypothetical protein AMATHDRAFT_88134 [Amanita thiersii Skay4041]
MALFENGAMAFLKDRLKLDAAIGQQIKSSFTADDIKHVYIRQTHADIPFANAVANVAFNGEDKVVAFGSSFVEPSSIAPPKPTISFADAIATAESTLSGKYTGSPMALRYVISKDNHAALAYSMHIRNEQKGTWVDAFVDAHSGKVIHIVNFVQQAAYLALPITKQSLTEGFKLIVNPQDKRNSPLGWHSTGNKTFTGNNAIAFLGNNLNAVTNQSSSGLRFEYRHSADIEPTAGYNIDAARTNAFYVVNILHDIWYRYGFTEKAFNFQQNNFGKGGAENDPVQISVQSTLGVDNAAFSTPPDGMPGTMFMFLWDLTTPMRDGALENDIVTHENTHGLTSRLTGGGTADCLFALESLGLAEGWSDAMANWMEQDSANVRDFVLGAYVTNSGAGVRSHPYSTDAKVNPLRYSSIAGMHEPHSIGEVWANMLHNVLAELVKAHGWSKNARTNPNGKKGNTIFLHLFMDGLALQPCNPSFVDARDAIIQADANRYKGAHTCLLWKVFASKGLGLKAANQTDNDAVPEGC